MSNHDDCDDTCQAKIIEQAVFSAPPDQPEDAALLEQLMHLEVETYQNGREWHVQLGTLISYGDNWERIMQLIAEAKHERHTLIVKKYKKLTAGMFGVKFYLDQPYPDDPRWTPWTRFILPRLKALEAAITKGEDLGDLAALQPTQPPAADTTKQGEGENRMSKFTFQVKYTSLGDVTVEADTEEEALEKAGRKLKLMQDLGDIGSDREFISWSGDEVELDGEELDGYFDD